MAFGRNEFNCECGGLRHICARWGCLPGSQEHYRRRAATSQGYEVVWSGTLQKDNAAALQLVPDRQEHADDRMAAMPTYDIDDGEMADVRPRRRYNLTGLHIGKFSRTDPTKPHYKPTIPRSAAPVPPELEEEPHVG